MSCRSSSIDMKVLTFLLFTFCSVQALQARKAVPLRHQVRREVIHLARGGARRIISSKESTVKPATATVTDESIIPTGTASMPNEVFNLVKSIVGAGVLGLPAGIAAVANAPDAIVPALLLISSIGLFAGYGFSVIGLVCGKTKALSYREAWKKTVGPQTSWVPALACLLVTSCSVLTYSMVLADTVPTIVQGLTGVVLTRNTALLGTTAAVILPLCLKKSLNALAPFSLVGILGMVYTCAVMMLRFLTGAYAPGGKFAAGLTLKPQFGTMGWTSFFSANVVILVSMLSTAFMAHYNAPKFYWELRDNTTRRYNQMVGYSFLAAIVIMALTAVAGFGTFGASVQSVCLNNYAVTDGLMSISRMAVVVSLLCSYPLAFVGVREGVLDLAQVPHGKKRDQLFAPLSVGLLGIITALAVVIPDIRIILALGGATWGNFIIYLAPALMLVKAASAHPELRKEVPKAIGTGILGTIMAMVATWRALASL